MLTLNEKHKIINYSKVLSIFKEITHFMGQKIKLRLQTIQKEIPVYLLKLEENLFNQR